MPTRYLKPGIRDSERIEAIQNPDAEVLYYRLLVSVDDFGRFDGRADMIKAACFPIRKRATAEKCIQWIEALQTAGLLYVYSVDGKPYIQVGKWDNKARSQLSKFPAPPPDLYNCMQMYADCPQVGADCPQVGADCPQVGADCPQVGADCPQMLPGTGTGTENREPEPRTGNREPEPRTGNREPEPRTGAKAAQRPKKPDAALPDWIPLDAWEGFLEMRAKINAPLTGRAKQLVVITLEKLRSQGQDAGAVLNQSVERGWRGVFPIRAGKESTSDANRQAIEEWLSNEEKVVKGERIEH